MVKEEIITGIKNGMARGESLQQAIQTLIGAGYNPEEVNDAANNMNAGVIAKLPQNATTITDIQKAVEAPAASQQTINQNQQMLPTEEISTKKKIPKKIIILSSILGIIILLLVLIMIFGEKILDSLI